MREDHINSMIIILATLDQKEWDKDESPVALNFAERCAVRLALAYTMRQMQDSHSLSPLTTENVMHALRQHERKLWADKA